MPLPDKYLPREGDVVVLHATVEYDVRPGRDMVSCKVAGSVAHYIPLESVVAIHARRWDADDKVIYPGMEGVGTVLATHEDQVWVLFPSEPPQTFPANELLPAPEPVTDETTDPDTIAALREATAAIEPAAAHRPEQP